MRDPKVGYHWIWIIPVQWSLTIYFKCLDKLHQKIHQRRIDKFLRDNPDAKRLYDLSGINKKQ